MTQPVFEIRAHHLNRFAELFEPGAKADSLAAGLVALRQAEAETKPNYSRDVIGKTARDAFAVSQRFKSVFSGFVELTDMDPLSITIGKKDGICESCHTGAHCVNRGEEFAMETPDGVKRVFATDIDDMCVLSAFLKAGRSLVDAGMIDDHLGFPVEQEDYLAEPSENAIPILGNVSFQLPVMTSAGFVKSVLRHII